MGQVGRARTVVRLAMVAILTLSGVTSVLAAEDVGALNRQSVQLRREGKYKDAMTVATEALALAERTLAAEDPDRLTATANLASVYRAQGRYGEAEPFFSKHWPDARGRSGRSIPAHSRASTTSVSSIAPSDVTRRRKRF